MQGGFVGVFCRRVLVGIGRLPKDSKEAEPWTGWKNHREETIWPSTRRWRNVIVRRRGDGGSPVMRKRRGLASAVLGLVLGYVLGFLIFRDHRHVIGPVARIRGDNWTELKRPYDPERFRASKEMNRDDSSIDASGLVFVGVMTAQKYLGTRAKAVYETWGSQVPGKISFFSSGVSKPPGNCPGLPLVALPRVDDSYPPQKKSFLMLQYMWNRYGDRYEWFLRADDDVYVRMDRLEKLLRSVDSRKPAYIGQAGRGNSEEFGLLSLEYDENFCMGGPGVILSRETLRRIVPHIKSCLQNLYTTHEDVELGRCVRKHAGVSCTWSYEMQSILYHNSSGDMAFTGKLKKKEIHRAITLHPVKSPPHMYRLHNYMRGLKIQELQQEKIHLHRDIVSMRKNLGISTKDSKNLILRKQEPFSKLRFYSEEFWSEMEILGAPAGLRSFRPSSSDQVIPWDFISRSEYSLGDSNPRRRLHSDVKEGLEDITREVMDSINSCSRQRGRVIEERTALYGYRRVDLYGADTILDLLLVYRKYRGKKVTLPVRRHVYLHQQFTGLEIREVVDLEEANGYGSNRKTDQSSLNNIFPDGILGFSFSSRVDNLDPVANKIIHFILPLSGRYEIFQRFLNNYEEICLSTSDPKCELMVVLYPHRTENSYEQTIRLIERTKSTYSNAKITIFENSGNFSRAQALDRGTSRLRDGDLMFFVDVDIVFTASALRRIRLNTVQGRQVYFPVVFSQYDPKMVYGEGGRRDSFAINEITGFWRLFGFGIVSLYKHDYKTIGGFDLAIQGWGKEDVDFFEKAVRSDVDIFRAPDKNLIHVHHGVKCDESLKGIQLSMCKGTRADTYASTEQLAKLIYRRPEYLRFAKARRNSKRASPPPAA